MRAAENPIRKIAQALIESCPGITRRELTRQLYALGHRIDSKSLSAMLRRMRDQGQIYHTGKPMAHELWPGTREIQEEPETESEITRVMRPAAPSDFNFPFYATPLQWSMAHLLGSLT